jgi:predicted Ser/Thr protein kinase
MTDEEKNVWDGVERRKHNLVVLPSRRGNVEPPEDKNAAVEEAIQSLLDVKGNIGRIFILYESLDGKRLGSVDSGMTAEQVLMMIELFKQWLLHGQYQRPGE